MDAVSEIFPTAELLPKARTGCDAFLRKFGSYDGRGVVICIMDTGVDPGAAGLQVTTDGQPKIIDLVDTTGSGDVVLDKVVAADSLVDGSVEGVSGRRLQIPKDWLERTKEFRLGLKSSYDLFPDSLSSRLTKEFHHKIWDPMHRKLLGEAHSLKAKFEKMTPTNSEEALEKDNGVSQEECLTTIDKRFNYTGELFDVISFRDINDGSFYACLDRSDDGDLSKAKLMRAFREAQEFDRLDELSLMNYSFRFHDDGQRLEIVTTGTSHGTHVAAIAAGHFPDEPEKNGVAPGAQIIGLKIGDNRLKGMETGTSLMRACSYIANSGADIVNYSFGEACHIPNCGKVCNEITNLVFKHNIIFCSSSGNHGPALSTVGAPGGTQDCVIGISPVVFPEMMEAEYSLASPVRGGVYTWASRGPTADGAMGIDMAAPGAAITSVPNWTLKNGQLMNGSSMSSPNACGCFSLLLSALKQEGMEYNPSSVVRAFRNTTEMLDPGRFGALDQGAGCVMVDRAWDYCNQYPIDISDNFRYNIRVNNAHRGIYVREWDTLQHPKVFTVTITPEAQESMKNQSRVELELKLTLVCDQSWVIIPKYMLLNNSQRNISIRVDPAALAVDSLNFTEVKAYDSTNVKKGPVFSIPVTVIVPTQPQEDNLYFRHVFKQGDISRHYIRVPQGATGCQIRIRCASFELSSCRLALHCLQLMPQEYYKSHELHRYLNVGDAWEEYYFTVVDNRTLEVVVARWWSVAGESDIEWSVHFTGLKPSSDRITILPGEQFCKVSVMSHLAKEDLLPSAQITNLVIPIRPTNCEMCPTCQMDINPNQEIQFAMKLTYGFTLVKNTEVTACFPLLNDLLYESDFTCQMWQLYDTNKKLVGVGDYLTEKYSYKLDKGDYTLFMLVKNESQSQLDRLKDMIMLLYLKQANNIPLEFYGSLPHMSANRKFSPIGLLKNSIKSIYVTAPNDEKIPKNATPGSFLLGTVCFHKNESWKKIVTYPLKIVIGDPPKKPQRKAKAQSSDDEKVRNSGDLKENIRNLRLSTLAKLEPKEEADKLYEELVTEFGEDDLELCYNRLLSIVHFKITEDSLKELVRLCDKLVKGLANDDLAHFCINKAESFDTKHTAKMEKQKSHLIETLNRTGVALAVFIQNMADKSTEECKYYKKELDRLYADVKKWNDIKENKSNFFIEYYCAKGFYASALKLLFKNIEEKANKETETRVIEMMRKLKWDDLASIVERQVCLKYPLDYKPC